MQLYVNRTFFFFFLLTKQAYFSIRFCRAHRSALAQIKKERKRIMSLLPACVLIVAGLALASAILPEEGQFFEGDLKLSQEFIDQFYNPGLDRQGNDRVRRDAMADDSRLWPSRTLAYSYHSSVSTAMKAVRLKILSLHRYLNNMHS